MMKYTISHLGVPIGSVDLAAGDTVAGELAVQPGYASVQSIVRDASEFLWARGFLADGATAPSSLEPAVLGRAQALPLELRDEFGAFVPADFVNIVERPTVGEAPVAFVRFRQASAATPSERSNRQDRGGESSR